MDKNKSRTDLLAAGRKRLQQFRQKKEEKGSGSSSHGKSSKKHGKVQQPGVNTDSVSSDDRPTESTHLTEDGTTQQRVEFLSGNVEPSGLHHMDNVAPETDTSEADYPSVLVKHETHVEEPEVVGQAELPVTESLVPQSDSNQLLSSLSASFVVTAITEVDSAQENDAESMHFEHDSPDEMPPIQESGDQVTDESFLSEEVNRLELTIEPPRTLDVDTVNANKSTETMDNKVEVESASSKKTPELLSLEVDSLPTSRMPSSSSAPAEVVVTDNIGSQHGEPQGDHPIDGSFFQVKEDLHNLELYRGQSLMVGVDVETSDEGRDITVHKAEASNFTSLGTSKVSSLEVDSLPSNMLPSQTSASTGVITVMGSDSSLDIVAKEEHCQQHFPDLSLIQPREDQEAHSVGTEQLVRSSGMEHVEEGEHHVGVSFVSVSPVPDRNEDDISVNTSRLPDVTLDLSINRRRDEVVITSDNDSNQAEVPQSQRDAINQFADTELLVGQDANSRIIKLANYLKELNEDEFKHLIQLRNSGDSDGLSETKRGIGDVLEAYREQIYVTNVAKEIYGVQLAEQSKLETEVDHLRQQCDDEVSRLRKSLEECNERKQTLDEELMQCQSELQSIAGEKKEREDRLQIATKNIEELTSAVNELQNKFDRSQGDLAIVSKELFDCKGLVETLLMEKDKLSESLTSMFEERKIYDKEKDHILKENEKLLLDLHDLEKQLAHLRVEGAELSCSLNSVTEDKVKLEEERELLLQENSNLSSELGDCKGLLLEIQAKHTRASKSITVLTEEKDKLDSEKHDCLLDYEKLASDMAECRDRLADLQTENVKLGDNLMSEVEEMKKLKAEKEYLQFQYEVLLSENHASQDALWSAREKTSRLEADKNKANLLLEQLFGESIYLNSCLEVVVSKVREIHGHAFECRNEILHADDSRSNGMPNSDSLATSLSGGPAIELLPRDCFSFTVMKGHLDEAEISMHSLDKAIEELHYYSSNQQDGEASAKGVSSLIQKSESKAHIEDQEVESTMLSVDTSAVSPLALVKEQTGALRGALKQLFLDFEDANRLFMSEEMGSRGPDAALGFIDSQYTEAVQELSEKLEVENIELQVQNLALKENLRSIARAKKNSETGAMHEIFQQRQMALELENKTLCNKLKGCQSRVVEMHSQLLEIKDNMDGVAPAILCQIRNMEGEALEEVSRFEHRWNFVASEIIDTIGRLDARSGRILTSDDSTGFQVELGITNCVASSVDFAIRFIEKLVEESEALKLEYQSLDSLYKEVNRTYSDSCEKNAISLGILQKVHEGLRSLVTASHEGKIESDPDIKLLQFHDPLNVSSYEMLIEQLSHSMREISQLRTENGELRSEVSSRAMEIEELNSSSHDIMKLVEQVEGAVKVATVETNTDRPLISRLENSVTFLLHAYKEADEKHNLFTEAHESTEMELTHAQGKLQQLNSLSMQQESEIQHLRASLSRAEEQVDGVHTELRKKVAELEQSEQRVSSVREKLSIAVAKGKGLIVQRDNLKQSLTETSSELDKCRQQIQQSEKRLFEAETKLKTYSEAGERVEALESELSYIRNTATALRESFLLKDSVLQRIEEILEDLELPEHLQSREIIDKVDWLARSLGGNTNTMPGTDWDQKSSPERGSYSDSGFVVMDSWKDDIQHNSTASDELKGKYEELQNKFYGLAEQNEMLEQSLMERNNLVQRLEEVLDKIKMPAHLQSMESESRIEWLSGALTEAHQHTNALQESLNHLEQHCEKLTSELEESRRSLSDMNLVHQSSIKDKEDLQKSLDHLGTQLAQLTAELEESRRSLSDLKPVHESTIKDKENLQNTLANLTRHIEIMQERANTFELENNRLQTEISDLQENIVNNRSHIDELESGMRRMLVLICNALKDPSLNEVALGACNILQFEEILSRLIDDHSSLSTAKSILQEADDSPVQNTDATLTGTREMGYSDHDASAVNILKKEMEEALSDLAYVKEERDMCIEKQQSLCHEIEALRKTEAELQHLLSLEEQKSASVREKLNVAVRKGKSLVQQRDSLKQTIEDMIIRVDNLTSEINLHQSTISQYEEKCRDLSSYPEKLRASQSDNEMLRSRLSETEQYLQEERRIASSMLNTLNELGVNGGVNGDNPVEKLQQFVKAYRDLLSAKANSDQESMKSRRAAELLLAELNEVQERNDGLQDELNKVIEEVSELSKGKKIAEEAKIEVLAQLSKVSAAQLDEHKERILGLKSGVREFGKYFNDIIHLLADVFSTDMDLFKNLELCLNASDVTVVYGDAPRKFSDNGILAWEKFVASDSWLTWKTQDQFDDNFMDDICGYVEYHVQDCTSKMSNVKEKLQRYLMLKAEEAARVATSLRNVHAELEKGREFEKKVLLHNIWLLYEACLDSLREIGKRKMHMSRDSLATVDMEMGTRAAETVSAKEDLFMSEEHIRSFSEKLFTAVKDLSNMEEEMGEVNRKELRTTIVNLQKEIQEKDIQRERMCMELVGQIKRAESAATNYSRELEVQKGHAHDLETQISEIRKEKKFLEQKIKEIEDEKTTSVDLEERVRSMTDILSAKEQEIESLMQALDEEESEMEEMNKRVKQMETELQLKNTELVKLEASHNKVLKKLSTTVSKFDELHDLSASLLTEVEKLQVQVQERDEEISFLRQEVTRCTNDILRVSQTNSKTSSDEILDIFEWLEAAMSRVHLTNTSPQEMKPNDTLDYKESIQNQISSVISELEDLQRVAQSKTDLLQAEKRKVQELVRKGESLETALRQKEAQLNLLEEAPINSESRGIEHLGKNWAVPGSSSSSQVRSLRKSNNDQVAIAIEDDPSTSGRLEDEDDDKVHGFKSLTTLRIVPRFTRPFSDMVDGLWVSCDRTLMRQPALRLTIILYWALLHSLLAAFVV